MIFRVSGTFQFQTGSIKRRQHLQFMVKRVLSFNSKLVRLKVWVHRTVCFVCYSFNSKLVRLKVKMIKQRAEVTFMFQFQTGSIKSPAEQTNYVRMVQVSIPNWFD